MQSNDPSVPNLGPFCSTTSHFRDTRLLKIWKIGNARNNLKINTQQPQSTLHTLSTYPSPRAKFWSVSLYCQLVSRCTMLSKNRKYTQWPILAQTKHLTEKSTLYTVSIPPPRCSNFNKNLNKSKIYIFLFITTLVEAPVEAKECAWF